MKKTIALSLGGSVFHPKEIDFLFLKRFTQLLKEYTDRYKFIIVTGGGYPARKYMKAAQKINPSLTEEEIEWLGIETTKLNAFLLKTTLPDITHKKIVTNPNRKVHFKKVLLAAGYKPGHSTDYDLVVLAKTYNLDNIINMTNVDYLYDKNPHEFKEAQKMKKATWSQLQAIVGREWVPGLNTPFDPQATQLASKLKLKLIFIGKSLENFKNLLDNKEFKGTVIQ